MTQHNDDPQLNLMTRSDDHATSQVAAEKVLPHLSQLQRKVMDVFQARGTVLKDKEGKIFCGYTDSELTALEVFKGHAPSTARKRRTELVKFGMLRDSGYTRANSYGNDEVVWEVVA